LLSFYQQVARRRRIAKKTMLYALSSKLASGPFHQLAKPLPARTERRKTKREDSKIAL
jgi:hypothetical protein